MVLFWARTSIEKGRKSSDNPTELLQISLIQYFKIQHNLRIYSDSRGIRMPNPA